MRVKSPNQEHNTTDVPGFLYAMQCCVVVSCCWFVSLFFSEARSVNRAVKGQIPAFSASNFVNNPFQIFNLHSVEMNQMVTKYIAKTQNKLAK